MHAPASPPLSSADASTQKYLQSWRRHSAGARRGTLPRKKKYRPCMQSKMPATTNSQGITFSPSDTKCAFSSHSNNSADGIAPNVRTPIDLGYSAIVRWRACCLCWYLSNWYKWFAACTCRNLLPKMCSFMQFCTQVGYSMAGDHSPRKHMPPVVKRDQWAKATSDWFQWCFRKADDASKPRMSPSRASARAASSIGTWKVRVCAAWVMSLSHTQWCLMVSAYC